MGDTKNISRIVNMSDGDWRKIKPGKRTEGEGADYSFI